MHNLLQMLGSCGVKLDFSMVNESLGVDTHVNILLSDAKNMVVDMAFVLFCCR